jgi:hypothetical protein
MRLAERYSSISEQQFECDLPDSRVPGIGHVAECSAVDIAGIRTETAFSVEALASCKFGLFNN